MEPEYMHPIGYRRYSRCGYCNRDDGSSAYYASSQSMSPEFYMALLDKSWRRSGTLFYRPNQRKSCCPHYPLRLDTDLFKPSRDQRQLVNRFNHFLLGQGYIKAAARLYPRSRAEAKRRDNEFNLIERLHEAKYLNLKTPPEPEHKFTVTLEEDTFTEEKYQVYNSYQKVVHDDPPEERTTTTFKRFLCGSPLRRGQFIGADGCKRQVGSFHQCYRLDGRLVAIGVLDLLPHCVSSVYLCYDESFQKHMPGKLGALHEIAMAKEQGYRWWYPGFYIHSCPKMRYKRDYAPQAVLDPESLNWFPLDKESLELLDKKAFVEFAKERQSLSSGNLEPRQEDEMATEDASTLDDNHEKGMASDSDEEEERHISLFSSGMPGVESAAQVLAADLGDLVIRVPQGTVRASNLNAWCSANVTNKNSLEGTLAEFVAATGTEFLGRLGVDFTRPP